MTSVVDFIQSMKAAGVPPEQIIIAVEFLENKKIQEENIKAETRKEKVRARVRRFRESSNACNALHALQSVTDVTGFSPSSNPPSHYPKHSNLFPKEKTPKGVKKKSVYPLPDWIPEQDWNDWVEMRMKSKKPPTERALSMAITELESLQKGGQDPGKVLQQSIFHNWPGLYMVKNKGSPGKDYRETLPSFREQT